MDLFQVADDAAGWLPEPAGVFVSPLVVALDREPVAGQVEALASLPARAEDRGHDQAAGRPAIRRQRPFAGDVPGTPRHGALAVAGAFEAEPVLRRGPRPLGRRDGDDGV